MKKKSILISAGEESGDLHGRNLVRSLKALDPELQFTGLGGKKMKEAGVRTLSDIDRMGGIGLSGLLGSFFHHWQVYRLLAKEIKGGEYSAAILIHYPMFNLLLAKLCKKKNIPAYFFISPQVWAWRKGRVKSIKRTIRKMFVILPFEEKIYRDAGVDVEFVGHPFIELVTPTLEKDEAFGYFGLKPGVPTVGMLPGSRKSEIDRLLSPMLEAASQIQKEMGACQFILPVADTIDPEYLKKKLQDTRVPIVTVSGKTYDVVQCCDFIICVSGSATLEAGILGCPMVIIYRFNPITYLLGRWLVKIKFFGLVNIVAGEGVVPELLQGEVTPENITRSALAVLKNPDQAKILRSRLMRVRDSLGERGVADRLARSILEDLNPDTVYELKEVSV